MLYYTSGSQVLLDNEADRGLPIAEAASLLEAEQIADALNAAEERTWQYSAEVEGWAGDRYLAEWTPWARELDVAKHGALRAMANLHATKATLWRRKSAVDARGFAAVGTLSVQFTPAPKEDLHG